MARRWVEAGDQVEWFTAAFPGAPPRTEIDGVRILRSGHQWTVHAHAVAHYRGRLHGRFDVVIDEVNTLPFFTPWWAGIPTVLLIYQLAREVWWYETPFPVNAVGFALETWYLRAYRGTPAFTISASTEADLRRLHWRAPITVIPVGIERNELVLQHPRPDPPPSRGRESPPHPPPSGASELNEKPVFLYAGRLAPSKRVHEILGAFALFHREAGGARLCLMGDGPPAYLRRLRQQAERLRISQDVEFAGWMDGDPKRRRMARAAALLMASVREGWGLVVTEAADCGTPAIVYDVPGLRDAVRTDKTGLIVPPEPAAMAAAMHRLVHEHGLRERLGAEARAWSRTFTFERMAAEMHAGLERAAR
ncbi:MAG: glycosyltransferase [Chloroflexi bacterium]|nr:MAG: glycosyltransferase [Chloroflexota bacterium]